MIIVIFLPLASKDYLTSTKLLGIVAALSFGTLFWEMISALDGRAGPAYTPHPPTAAELPHEHDVQGRVELWTQTFEWQGRPCLAEPGLYVRDKSHQRLHKDDQEPEKMAEH